MVSCHKVDLLVVKDSVILNPKNLPMETQQKRGQFSKKHWPWS